MAKFSDTPGEPPRALVAALARLLRPLIRLLLVYGVTFPYLTKMLKGIYVEVAERDFPVADKPQSDSRVSLLTGVHRKDVRRLRAEPHDLESEATVVLSIGTQLIARWVGERRYLDGEGEPKALPLRSRREGGTSFEQLVAAVSRHDLRPRVVLDELLRLGIVQMTEDGRVELNVQAFVPEQGFDEKSFYFGQNIRDHIAAAANNLEGQHPPFLDRSVFYHGLSEKDAAELAALAEELGMDALKTVNRRAMTMKRRNQNRPGRKMRMNFGVFYFSAEDTTEASDADDE